MRTDEAFSCTHNRAYQTASEKQTGRLAGRSPARAIYACTGRASAARLRIRTSLIPDILHGSYLGLPSNLPLPRIIRLRSRTRALAVYQYVTILSRVFSVKIAKFFLYFCAGFTKPQNGSFPADRIDFAGRLCYYYICRNIP